MTPQCPVADCPDWWQGYSADMSDEEARMLAARKFGIPLETVELRRNKGAVLAHERKETKWTQRESNETSQMTDS